MRRRLAIAGALACAIPATPAAAAAPSRLMLPIVPMSQVLGFQPPPGPCAYASMRCLPGSG